MEKKSILHSTLLDGLLNLCEEDAIMSKDLLKEEGIDIDENISRSLNYINDLKSKLQLKVQKESHFNRINYLLERLRNLVDNDIQKYNKYLGTIMPAQENLYAFRDSKPYEEWELIDLNKLEDLVTKLDHSN